MSSLAPVAGRDERDRYWHVDKINEFTALKALIGEPSPHMTVTNHLSRELDLDERLWRIGCYAAPYSLVTAHAIWTRWPTAPVRYDGLDSWIENEWEGFHTRTERRAVRTPGKFMRCLNDWAALVNSGEMQRMLQKRASYDEWWDTVNRVAFFGRYISIRVIEAIRRMDPDSQPQMELTDIRSIGGHSPIRALTLFFPEKADRLLAQDAKLADGLAEVLLRVLNTNRSQPINHYVYAAMLCEYREAFEDRHQYPARTLDQELEYLRGGKSDYWRNRGLDFTPLWEARGALFPARALGEVTGKWTGIRDDLSKWLRDRGQNWSDLQHVYGEAA